MNPPSSVSYSDNTNLGNNLSCPVLENITVSGNANYRRREGEVILQLGHRVHS